MTPRLAITMGDANGIGPELLVKALRRPEIRELCVPVIYGDARRMHEVAAHLGSAADFIVVTDPAEAPAQGEIGVIDAGFHAPAYRPGVLDSEAGRCAVEWFKAAVAAAQAGAVAAVVTCPINKEGIHRAGYAHAGHTDMLAALTGADDYRMCLFSPTMRVVHVSGHHSMRDALNLVTRERVETSIRIGHDALLRLALARRRIAVAGLNPHAGEAGAFGREEIEEITPAVEQCRREGIDCTGPISPDAVFRQMIEGHFDMVIAMYHDQGHIPVKLMVMDEGVNVTLGLPVIRTSVDHGTAYDIAGKGVAREHSLIHAITLAAQLASSTQ
jgi:4-phospho-D-threonate 3-dehydrogenase / 4-phospho-D-erythronate 3-dehydrogenase